MTKVQMPNFQHIIHKYKIKCPVCGKYAVVTSAWSLFGNKAYNEDDIYYACPNKDCDTYVKAHNIKNGYLPMGQMATRELRKKRQLAHHYFDRTWKEGVFPTRKAAYKWLTDKTSWVNSKKYGGIVHIGNFSEYLCDLTIKECKKLLREHKK